MLTLRKFMMFTAPVLLICAGTAPVQAVTCEDVRSLSRAEQDYWSKQLNLTREQRHQISVLWQGSEWACGPADFQVCRIENRTTGTSHFGVAL